MKNKILWVERYRPQTVKDCILPEYLQQPFQSYVDNKTIPNLLLSGGPGMGKTTVAKAMCNEIGLDYLIVNGSEETGIDLLRVKLTNYCSSVSLMGGRKVVIIDEADYLNPTSTQPALRGFIEKFSDNCSFIFTCNYKNRIIDPIHSRTSVIDFRIDKRQQPTIAHQLLKRVLSILDENEIQYEEKVIAEVILKYFPDFRRILNELQRYSQHGVIDTGIFQSFSDTNFRKLVNALKDKKFTEIRKWVVENSDNDPKLIYRKLYDNIQEYLEPSSVPPAILLLADYQHKAAFVADQEINLTACLIEMMVDCVWK